MVQSDFLWQQFDQDLVIHFKYAFEDRGSLSHGSLSDVPGIWKHEAFHPHALLMLLAR